MVFFVLEFHKGIESQKEHQYPQPSDSQYVSEIEGSHCTKTHGKPAYLEPNIDC